VPLADPPALLDTNVLASALTSPRGAPRALLEYALRGDLRIVTSAVLLAELERCLREVFRYNAQMSALTRDGLAELAMVVEPTSVPNICRDPDDNHVLAAGSAGGASHIVTRDKDLLVLERFAGIDILEPAPFLQQVRARW